MLDLFIRVIRKKQSYDFKRYPNKKDDWNNNDINNMLDDFILFAEEERLFSVKVQTVANIPNGRPMDTVAPGLFSIKTFVEPRLFYGEIHGICDTYDLEGQYIDRSCTEINDKSRWLVHDTQKQKPNPPNQLTRVAWSNGCFVMHPSDLNGFNRILHAYKIQKNDFIHGELLEE